MVQLISYEECHASKILSWIQSSEELRHWTARDDFPLKDISVFKKWHSDPDIEPWLLIEQEKVCGYGELWCEADEPWAEMARLLIDPAARGKGLGKQLVNTLAEIIKQKQFDTVWVRVIPTNQVALGCYHSSGFTPISYEESKKLNSTEQFDYIWLKKEVNFAQSKPLIGN